MILCRVDDGPAAEEICGRLAAALEDPIPLGDGCSVVTSASVGMAVFADGDDTTAADLLAEADRAVLAKKRRQSSDC